MNDVIDQKKKDEKLSFRKKLAFQLDRQIGESNIDDIMDYLFTDQDWDGIGPYIMLNTDDLWFMSTGYFRGFEYDALDDLCIKLDIEKEEENDFMDNFKPRDLDQRMLKSYKISDFKEVVIASHVA